MENSLIKLYETVKSRKDNPAEGSYTCYLFEQGKDKICKKIAEEAGETIIAAKNCDNFELKNEICDLLYHLTVLMADSELDIGDVMDELDCRSQKIGNLKKFKNTDRNT